MLINSGERIAALCRKEMLEILSERNSRRASAMQAGIFLGCLGVLFPLQRMTLTDDPHLVLLYVLGAGLLSASLSAESIGNERASGTLDTLLACPVQEIEILLGKLLASMLYGAGLSTLSIICASMVEILSGKTVQPPWELIVASSILCVAMSMLASCVAFIVALVVRSPRVAHQISSLGTIACLLGVGFVWEQLDLPVSFASLMLTTIVALIVGTLVLIAASALFRRTRLFDEC